MPPKPICECNETAKKKYVLCGNDTTLMTKSISSRREETRNLEYQFMIRDALDRERQAYLLVQKLNEQHQLLVSSLSWRITMPLRWVSLQLMVLRKKGVIVRIKVIVIRLLSSIRRHAVPLVSSFPFLHRSLVRVESIIVKYAVNGFRRNRVGRTNGVKSLMVVEDLSAGARSIYFNLSDIINKRKRNNK